jgi:hypothetical protein
MKNKTYLISQLTSLVFLVAPFVLPLGIKGQSDNFDSGSLSAAWTKYYADPSLASFTFPPVGSGKGLRIQAYPYAAAGVPAVTAIMQTNNYTDFYVALDLVNWVVEDQALVISARFTPGGTFGLDGGSGMILNYDAAQAGDPPSNRKGGEFQINTVTPGFTATTLAACEMTFVPGHSYRMVFIGVGTNFTGRVYDLEDLTTPLATIQAGDSTFTSGLSGILSFSRNGTGTTDVTVDNYYAAVSDPNLATPPALMHPIPGTPMVESRVPVGRWQNFHNPASGISFTAKTYTADVTAITGSLPGSALKSNALYSAQIELADTAGVLKSTNTFWFDTFSETYFSASPVKVIECEDYNYSNGVFQLEPIPVSGMSTNNGSQVNGDGTGYYDSNDGVFTTQGTEGVDFHTAQAAPSSGWDDYRPNDPVMTGEGIRQEIEDGPHPDVVPPWGPTASATAYNRPNDNTRQKYAVSNLVDYLVIRTHANDWLNYTRVFQPTNYFAFLRVGTFNTTTATLSLVTSDSAKTNQTTSLLGTFSIPDLVRKSNFMYIPALDTNGVGVIANLSGTNTVRLTMGGAVTADDRVAVLNYLLIVPAQVTAQSSSVASGAYLDDATAVVNLSTRTITIPINGAARFYRLNAIVPMKISSIAVSGGTVTLKF